MVYGQTRKLRILFLGNIAPYRIGGAEIQARWLACCFAKRGHQVVIAGYAVPNGWISADIGVSTKIETIHLPVIPTNRFTRGTSLFFSLSKLLLSRKNDYDLIFCSTFKDATLFVALLKRLGLLDLPVVVRCEGYGDSGDARFLKALPVTRWLVYLLNKGCDAVNSISPRIEAELTALGLRPGLFSRIPNGVPLPQLEKPIQNPNHSPRSILFAGRLVPQKGVPNLLRAVSQLKRLGLEFRINLVGHGPLFGSLQQMSRDLLIDDVVIFHGLVGPDHMVYHYNTNQILVLPSRQEAFGLVVAEAMSYSLPVVVTKSGGPEYLVDHRTGRVCPVGDVDALTAALKEMILMPFAKLQTMGQEARRLVQDSLDIEKTADRFLRLFFKLDGREFERTDP